MLEQKGSLKSLWYLVLSLLVIGLDYASKLWIINNIKAGFYEEYISVVDNFFRIVHVHNKGAAFSFLADHDGWQQWLFASIAIAISALLVVLIYKTKPGLWFRNTSFALLIGGALGNLYDRLVYNYVIDFLDFYVVIDGIERHYPAFNVADIAVCMGAAGILIEEIFFKKKAVS